MSKLTIEVFASLPQYNQLKKALEYALEEIKRDYNEKLLGLSTSSVHDIEDVEVQAFLLAIPSENFEDMIDRCYLAFATHIIDDYFDRNDLPPNKEIMFEKRKNVFEVLELVDVLRKLIATLKFKVKNELALKKGLSRLMYGGLIPLSRDDSRTKDLLAEYKKIALEGLDSRMINAVSNIREIPYWTTAKTIQEVFLGTDENVNLSLAEMWSIIYAPALYLHDYKEELENGEINFKQEDFPKLEELKYMIDIGINNISEYKDVLLPLRKVQLKLLINSFQTVLPGEIFNKYTLLMSKIDDILL